MKSPKISVIVPVYNVEDYLEDALDSLVHQTFIENMEVLMIDDGSSDNSRYIIEKYALNYDNFYAYHKENEGLSITRNYGLNFAKGEYVHFMDSDDYMLIDGFEKLYELGSKNDSDVVTANFLRYNEEKTWIQPIGDFIFRNLDANLINTNAFEYNNLLWDTPVWNKIYKREFLINEKIFFPDANILHEDNIFSMEILSKAKKISVLNDFAYCWRIRDVGKSITRQVYTDRGKDLYEMAEIVNDILNENISDEEMLNIKYRKLLTIDIPFYLGSIKDHTKEEYEIVFEGAYKLLSLVPKKYMENLNNYYKVLYTMIGDKDWENLEKLLSINLKRNPEIPKDIDEKYQKMFDFEEDAKYEYLDSYSNKVFLEEDKLAIKFTNYVPFHRKSDEDKVEIILKNSSQEDRIFDSSYIKDNTVFIPLDLIEYGENIVYCHFTTKNKDEKYFMKNTTYKTFKFDDFDIDIVRGKTGFLRINKRKKDNTKVEIVNVLFEDGKFKLEGCSNNKIENIILNDQLNFGICEYPINYMNESNFTVRIDYKDFSKFPIKKWELKPNGDFNKINLTKSHRFFNENYIILLKNYENKIVIEFNRINPINKLDELNQEIAKQKKDNKELSKKNKKINEKNKDLNAQNKKLKNSVNQYRNRRVVKIMDKIKKVI